MDGDAAKMESSLRAVRGESRRVELTDGVDAAVTLLQLVEQSDTAVDGMEYFKHIAP